MAKTKRIMDNTKISETPTKNGKTHINLESPPVPGWDDESVPIHIDAKPIENRNLIQWSTPNGYDFFPCGKTVKWLTPGYYEINNCDQGMYFTRIPVQSENLIDFKDGNTHKILEEIQKFWERESYFREYGLSYKRGILCYGQPGNGKSCLLQLISADVISRNGIVLKFENPSMFSKAMRLLRDIQPAVPVVALMEDIDSILMNWP